MACDRQFVICHLFRQLPDHPLWLSAIGYWQREAREAPIDGTKVPANLIE
jgi:hypothetical protein